MVNPIAPFGYCNVFVYAACYLGMRDVAALGKTCKAYREWTAPGSLAWKNASLYQEKIPVVDGCNRNYVQDYLKIREKLSTVHGLLGRVLGPVPLICEKVFNKFLLNDPDRYGEGYFRDNFVLLMKPSYIERHVDKETPLALQDGKLVEVDPAEVEEQTLVVAATLPNLLMLFKYPLKGKEHLPVYRINEDLLKIIREQCVYFPETVGVEYMRKNIIEDTRLEQFERQQAIVEEKAPGEGNVVKGVRERLLFDGACILKTGTCPDVQKPRWTAVRGTETVDIWDGKRNLVAGGFAPGAGVSVVSRFDFDDDRIGVVPGGSAEVLRPLELGHLAIDEGH